MSIDKPALVRMLSRSAALWRQNMDELTAIDSRFGDGDHGVTMGKIADAVDARLDGWNDGGIAAFMAGLAEAVMAVPGGSAAPLYGTFLEGMAGAVPPGADTLDGAAFAAMLAAGLDNLQTITKASIGDKTMLDAIIPAVRAAAGAGGKAGDVLRAAAGAAEAGAAATATHVAKFGRARSYADATLGTPDVGALSAAMMFRGFYEGWPA